MRMTHGMAVWTMVGCTVLWSMAGVVTRHLEEARSFEVTFWRSFFTVVSLLIILPLWQGMGVWSRMPWRNRYFWLSGVCWSVMFTAFMVALTLTAVANVLITMAVGPLFTALFTRVFLRHKLPLRTWVAIVVAGIGIGWMYGTQLSLGDPNFLVGSLVALCVPIAGAVQWTLAQKSQSDGHSLDLVPSVLLGAVFSTLLTLPLAMPFQASAHDVGLLATLGLFQLAIPCVLSVICVRVLKAPEASLLCLLEIVFGIALAWLGANEAPQMSVLLGGSLVLGALLMNQWLGWKQNNV
jgi:drug/metabolite transporter (DMT)-like permease